jgi:hypothetical protein
VKDFARSKRAVVTVLRGPLTQAQHLTQVRLAQARRVLEGVE